MSFSQYKKRSASFLDVDLNFSQTKNGSASSLDVDLNFFQIKNWFVSFLDTDLIFLIYADFETKEKIMHECVYCCLLCLVHVA